MSRPVVGIVMAVEPDRNAPDERNRVYVGEPYATALARAGATPVGIVPGTPAEEALPLLDGLLVMGGGDLDPNVYGQSEHPKTEQEPAIRFATERALWEAAPPELPVLGVCYGCQFLNAVLGGTIQQHLPDVVGNDSHAGGTLEQIRVDTESRLGAIVGPSLLGKSYHHQAIDVVALGLRAVAWAEDGTIEAVESPGRRWLVGVQWHPERSPDSEATERLFHAFVERAEQYRSEKVACGTW